MKKQRITALFLVMAMLFVLAVPASAEETTSDNLFKGLTATCSSYHVDYPVKNLTDGINVGTDANRSIIFKRSKDNPNATDPNIAWVEFDLATAQTINKISIQHSLNADGSARMQVVDVAVDVLLTAGGWKRVAADYNIEDLSAANIITFAPVEASAVRISFNCARNSVNAAVLTEIEGYYDSAITEEDYTGIETDEEFGIPAVISDLNLLRDIITTNYSYIDDYNKGVNPVSNLTDGKNKAGTGDARTIIYKLSKKDENIANGTISWTEFYLPVSQKINKINVQHSLSNGSPRIAVDNVAVDVRLAAGGWKRVAAVYDIDDLTKTITLNFEAVEVTTVRISFDCGDNNAVVLTEVEAYYDSGITEEQYTGINSDSNTENGTYVIPEILSDMNLLQGIVTDNYSYVDDNLKDSYPLENLTDGKNLNGKGEARTIIYNLSKKNADIANGTIAWVEFELPVAQKINKISIQHALNESGAARMQVVDLAVDVRLSTGGWKRVAAVYNIDDLSTANIITFAPVEADIVRISFNCARNSVAAVVLTEVEGYYDSTITEEQYIGINSDELYEIPEVLSDMNLLSGITAATSGGELDTGIEFITDSDADRESTPATINNVENTDTAWVEFEIPEAKVVNRIFIMQKYTVDGVTTNNKYADIAVEVRLGDSEWQKVASLYGISKFYDGNVLTFDAMEVDGIRVKAYGDRTDRTKLYVSEIGAYYYSTLTEFSGLSDNENLVSGTAVAYKTDGKTTAAITDGNTDTVGVSLTANNIAGFEIRLKEAEFINHIVLTSGEASSAQPKDIAIDVLTADDKWVRTVEAYDYSLEENAANEFTFKEAVNAKAIRISANVARTSAENFIIAEVEVYYRPENTAFSGNEPGSDDYTIKTVVAGDINLDYAANASDLVEMRMELLKIGNGYGLVDVTYNNSVDVRDLVRLKKLTLD